MALSADTQPGQKVWVLPNICGIEIDASGIATPAINSSLQPFFNTYVQDPASVPLHFTRSAVSLSEQGKDGRAGLVFSQKLTLRFPSNDPLRVERMYDYLKVKYIYIKLSTGMVLFFGRNDYFQNTKPKIAIKSTEKATEVSYSVESMFPLGFTNGGTPYSFPGEIPLNFYNL